MIIFTTLTLQIDTIMLVYMHYIMEFYPAIEWRVVFSILICSLSLDTLVIYINACLCYPTIPGIYVNVPGTFPAASSTPSLNTTQERPISVSLDEETMQKLMEEAEEVCQVVEEYHTSYPNRLPLEVGVREEGNMLV